MSINAYTQSMPGADRVINFEFQRRKVLGCPLFGCDKSNKHAFFTVSELCYIAEIGCIGCAVRMKRVLCRHWIIHPGSIITFSAICQACMSSAEM